MLEIVSALTIFDVKEWIAEIVPEWASSEVAPALKCLGCWLGPGAGSLVWAAPLAKWMKTAFGIGAPARLTRRRTTRAPFPPLVTSLS